MPVVLDRSRPLRLVAVKYDGRVHWETRPCYPVWERDGLLVLGYGPDSQFIHHTRGVRQGPGVPVYGLGFLWADRGYNVFYTRGVHPERGAYVLYYCNVALPPERRPGEVRFCDLDVDVTWRPGEAPRVEDEDEFALHAARYGYPEELRRGVAAATRDLLAAVAARQFPFDGTAEAWWEACFGGEASSNGVRHPPGARAGGRESSPGRPRRGGPSTMSGTA